MAVAPLVCDGVLDLETQDWDQYVLGGLLLDSEDESSWLATRDPEEMIDALFRARGTIWTWNGGKYDDLWLLEGLRERGEPAEITLAGQRITSLRFRNVHVRDAMGLWPTALAKAAKLVGLSKSEVGFPCECPRGCGGYCAIRRDMAPAKFKLLESYLRNDCEITLGTVRGMIAFAREHGIILRGTVGSSAWATIRDWTGIPKATWEHPRLYYQARAGYFGGRCQVFQSRASKGYRYDRNSAYPAALVNTAVPMGEPHWCESDRASIAFDRGLPGIYTAQVVVPHAWIPPLPWRSPEERVCYPTGPIRGSWSGNELRYAVECGTRIAAFGPSLVWLDEGTPIAPYMERLFDLRIKLGKESPGGAWLKWLLNAPTGKLAQDPEGEAALLWPETEPRACPGERPCSREKCSKRCRAWTPLDRAGALWSVPRWRIPESGYVHWAATLTADARIALHRQLVAGPDDAVYCDTDSCYAVGERGGVGTELGEWAFEGEFADAEDEETGEVIPGWLALAPKTYAYRDAKGKMSIRAKGIPGIDEEGFAKLGRGEHVVEERGVRTLKDAARSGGPLFQRRVLKRTLHADDVWIGDRKRAGTRTVPSTVREITRAGR